MSTPPAYSFSLDQTTWKSATLTYSEGARRLDMELERSGLPEFDWVGCDEELTAWTAPAGEAVSATERAEILARLDTWAQQERLRIDMGGCMDMEAYFAQQEAAGWTVEHRPDGTTYMHRPPRRNQTGGSRGEGGIWSCLERLFGSGRGGN